MNGALLATAGWQSMNRIGRRTLVLMAIWGVVGIAAISLSGC